MENDNEPPSPFVKSLKIGDRSYELLKSACPECAVDHFVILRFCRTSFSRYCCPPDFDCDDFENFVEELDEQLLMSSADMLADYNAELGKVNSKEGIEADFSMEFRLLEYARQRASALSKMGLLKALLSSDEPSGESERALRLAFELGAAVSEHRTMMVFEDYMWDGIAVREWRDSGLPKARQERLRQGLRSRKAVAEAAKRLYASSPHLLRNDTETARAILRLRLPDLQKSNSQQIGIDAVIKHLRSARQFHDN